MIKKTRINISTSFKIYFKFFLSLIPTIRKKNEKIFLKFLRNFFFTDKILLTSQGRVAAFNIFKVILSEKKKGDTNLPLYSDRNSKCNYLRRWETNICRN